MRKEAHISEFSAKKGDGLQVRVTTTREGKRIAVNGGRFYYKDYRTKTDCMRAAIKIREDILRKIDAPPAPVCPTVKDLFDRSFDYMPVAYLTQKQYEHTLRDHISDLQNKPINEITVGDIQMSVNRYAETHAADAIRNFMLIWKRVYKAALYMQIPVMDVPGMVIVPKSKHIIKKQDRSLDYETFIQAVGYLSSLPHYLSPISVSVAWILFYTGMRINEALALCVSDIDLDRMTIHVNKAISSTEAERAVIAPPKTEKSIRSIPIADELTPLLERLIANADRDLLFTLPDGSPVPSGKLTTWVNQSCINAGIKFSLYRLRHMFSADMFRQGVNPKVIQSLLGHATDNMSLYYAFTTEEEKADAISKRKPS